jgi:hypothetical protein
MHAPQRNATQRNATQRNKQRHQHDDYHLISSVITTSTRVFYRQHHQ